MFPPVPPQRTAIVCSRNNKLLGTSASLLVTSALLVVTRSERRNNKLLVTDAGGPANRRSPSVVPVGLGRVFVDLQVSCGQLVKSLKGTPTARSRCRRS